MSATFDYRNQFATAAIEAAVSGITTFEGSGVFAAPIYIAAPTAGAESVGAGWQWTRCQSDSVNVQSLMAVPSGSFITPGTLDDADPGVPAADVAIPVDRYYAQGTPNDWVVAELSLALDPVADMAAPAGEAIVGVRHASGPLVVTLAIVRARGIIG